MQPFWFWNILTEPERFWQLVSSVSVFRLFVNFWKHLVVCVGWQLVFYPKTPITCFVSIDFKYGILCRPLFLCSCFAAWRFETETLSFSWHSHKIGTRLPDRRPNSWSPAAGHHCRFLFPVFCLPSRLEATIKIHISSPTPTSFCTDIDSPDRAVRRDTTLHDSTLAHTGVRAEWHQSGPTSSWTACQRSFASLRPPPSHSSFSAPKACSPRENGGKSRQEAINRTMRTRDRRAHLNLQPGQWRPAAPPEKKRASSFRWVFIIRFSRKFHFKENLRFRRKSAISSWFQRKFQISP